MNTKNINQQEPAYGSKVRRDYLFHRHSYLWVFIYGSFIATFLTGICLAQTKPVPATASSPKSIIDNVLKQALATLRDTALSRDDKRLRVQKIAEATMDFDVLARLALGPSWRDLTEAQHVEFTKEFKTHIAATYGHTTDEYTDEDLSITADHEEPRGDWTVQTHVIGTKDGTRQEIAKVDYRLRQSTGTWKIIDVTIDGVSLMANFRSQFQDIMTNGGYPKLIKLLKEKNATIPK